MKFRIIFLLVFTVVFQGCASMYQDQKPKTITKEFQIEVISEPSGAKIEVNNNYVGTTPCTITIARRFEWQSWENDYRIDYNSNHEIVANPVFAGGYVQNKRISYWDNEVPKKIYFNMRLAPSDPTYNFNIN